MDSEEVLKSVFPFLDGTDLASCMLVCKQWRDIAKDDYFWKCVCAKRWPSVCKRLTPPIVTYYRLFKTFSRRQYHRTLLPPKLSFTNLEFYVDIWTEDILIFSEVVTGLTLQSGIKTLPSGIPDKPRFRLEGPEYKMIFPVEPRFLVPPGRQTVSVSVLVGRKDSNKIACIINKSTFDYIDRSACRALAFDYLDFSPAHPFVSGIRAWVSLLFTDDVQEGIINVFGIELDFCDAANSEEEVLWLLDMLDWK